MEKLKIEYVSLKDLKPNEYNPKQMTEKEAEDLKKSIEEFGVVDPLVVNKAKGRENIIIGGHQRYRIYQQLKYKQAPVVYLDIPDLQKEQELCLRLSKNTGSWDFDLLCNFDEDFLLDCGFESVELDNIFQLDDGKDADDVPEVRKTDIKLGDMFELGSHRLLCGDATSREDVGKLMGGKKADMVFTDPPYGMNYTGSIGLHGKKKLKPKLIGDTSVDVLKNSLDNINEFCLGAWYICYHRILMWKAFLALIEKGMQVRNVIIWRKNNITLSNSDYKSLYEPIIVGWADDYSPIFYGWNDDHLFYGRKGERDVWEIPSVWDVKKNKRNEYHSTQKPTALVERAIKNRGEIVLDLFGGSGSTMVAAHRLNRCCFMCEIDPRYCQVIIDRWQAFTGNKARQIDG